MIANIFFLVFMHREKLMIDYPLKNENFIANIQHLHCQLTLPDISTVPQLHRKLFPVLFLTFALHSHEPIKRINWCQKK